MKSYHFYIINILFCIPLQAQDSVDIFPIKNPLDNLIHGNLLVRLEFQEKKLDFLQAEMNSSSCDAKCKKRQEKKINEVIASRDSFNLQFMMAFKNYFSFCPVSFYYDKDHHALAEHGFNGNYFLNEQLQTISLHRFHKDSLLILKKDITPRSENEGWLFQTAEGINLSNDFPYVTVNNIYTFWNWLLGSGHQNANCIYSVQKLNWDLINFRNNSN